MNDNADVLTRLERAFGSGVAEQEAPWLSQVFLPPPRWERWLQPASHLIVGPVGSGRTAAARQLLAYGRQPGHPFAFAWKAASAMDPASAEWQDIARRIVRTGFEALVTHLVNSWPAGSPPPAWAASLLKQLAHDFVPLPFDLWLRQRFPPGVTAYLAAVETWLAEAPEPEAGRLEIVEAAQYLVVVAQALGFSGVWTVLDPPSELAETVVPTLTRIAEVLQWFDVPDWAFKWFLPDAFLNVLETSTVVVRRRMRVEYLVWRPTDMRTLVQRRLAWATQGRWQDVADIVADEEFAAWLAEYGRANPRVWLVLLHPFVRARAQKDRPLERDEWLNLVRKYPPPLYVDLPRRQVYLGAKPITLEAKPWKLLAYLYRHKGELCERRVLAYRALEDRDEVPEHDTFQWRSALDTAVHHLRRGLQILPEPSRHDGEIYVQTVRGRGLRLRHATSHFGLRSLRSFEDISFDKS